MMPAPLAEQALRPSRWLRSWILGIYGLGVLVSLHLPWPAPVRLLLALLLAGDAWLRLRAVRQTYGVRALRITARHQLQLQLEDGVWHELHLRAPCHVLPALIILHGDLKGRRRRYLLEPGMLPPEGWRPLKVWLTWRLPELLVAPPPWWRRLLRRWAGNRR